MNTLTQLIKTMPIDHANVTTFRARALQALDQAVDVFFHPERELAEGKKAYDRLTDVESALRAYQARIRQDVEGTRSGLEQAAGQWQRPEAKTETVENQPSVLPNGQPISRGLRQYSSAGVQTPNLGNVAGRQCERISAAVEKMGQVLPLYASVAMVPGPLSVSLKNHVQQTMQWNSQSQSSSGRDFHQESVRLLTLSAGRKTVRESSQSQSQGTAGARTVTVDERVMTGLRSIRQDLDGIGFVAAKEETMKLSQKVSESERVSYTTGWLFQKTQEELELKNSGYLELARKEVETAPAHIAFGTPADNRGLTPTTGSDLVDLVVSAPTLSPELLAQLQARGSELIDQAISTLFQTNREVADGRRAFDGLTNLARSLTLADQKWAPQHSQKYWQEPEGEIYASALGREIKSFEKAIALYACVAMVPGEMSSSVKNFAKELATFHMAGSSSSSSYARDVSGSLLLGGLSLAEDVSSSQSSHSQEGRFETTTSDERIMPALHRLRGRLEELEIHDGLRLRPQ